MRVPHYHINQLVGYDEQPAKVLECEWEGETYVYYINCGGNLIWVRERDLHEWREEDARLWAEAQKNKHQSPEASAGPSTGNSPASRKSPGRRGRALRKRREDPRPKRGSVRRKAS